MPSLITHYEFSKQNFPKNRKTFYLGSQGPDPFFYYGYTTPWKKNIKEIRNYGSYLHSIDSYVVFSFLLDYVKKIEDKEEEEILLAFVKGLMSHYILDRTCHPYIYYKTGFPLGGTIYTFYHSLFETYIDVLIEDYFNDHPSYKKMLKIKNKNLRLISEMMYELAKHLNYSGVKEDSYYKSVKTMLTVNRVINSKIFGFRKWLFTHIMKKSAINAMSHPKLKHISTDLDVLNTKGKEWHNFVTNEIVGDYSFIELMDKAKVDLAHCLDLIDDIYYNDLDKEPLNEFIAKIDHNGVKIGEDMKYFDLVFTNNDEIY